MGIPVFTPGPTNIGFTLKYRTVICSSVNASVGTTLETATAVTAAGSRPDSSKSCRSRIPYSSAVRFWFVWRRQWFRSVVPSNAPMTVLVFPTSIASSTAGG